MGKFINFITNNKKDIGTLLLFVYLYSYTFNA